MNSIILSDVPGKYTMIFNPDSAGYQAIVYAPYRMNASAFDMTNLNAHHPEFMPVLGSENVSGCQADVTLYFNYLDQAWWDSYWAPTWSGNANWPTADIMTMQRIDGFFLGVVYGVTLNRAAAEAWLGMPRGADASTWWAANSASYRSAWIAWLLNEGNSRLDIYSGYEWPLTDLSTMMDLVANPDGTITLSIGHISWGYEVLMTRWLTEAGVCNHEPWYEDFYLTAHYKDAVTQWVSFDACCQMSLHAVNATGSSAGSAWAWEPNAIDYVASTFQHPSDFDPYVGLTYTSQNAGDPMFGQEVPYEYTPTMFNVEMNSTLMFILPTGNDVIGYAGMRVPSDAILQIVRNGDYSAYEAITRYGAMTLGHYVVNQNGTGGPDLRSMYDPVANVLTIRGPVYFDNVRHPNGALYHGAPWIEFNVGPVGNLQPVAVISSVSVSGLKVTVDGSGSYDLDGTFLWYKWTWDDGSPTTEPSTSPTATHTYTVAGTYTIRLEVVDAGGRPDNTYRIVTVHSTPLPPGYWSSPVSIDTGMNLQTYSGPAVDSNSKGEAIAAWSEDNGTQWGVWANRFVPGSGWQGAEFVSSASPYTYTPCVGMDENGNATVAWISGGSILSRRYVSNSGWQGLTIVSNSQNNPSGLTMAVEGSGKAVMGWEAWDGSQWSIFASYRPIGDYWLAPTLIEGRAGQADT
ncbi:PKD domain-containing protein, partial [Candidatus Bathyarchaeota archaeon]|nr:PKD domain-containing protein [Candidatus Bathyarchaeota archaeon]